jgi:hypothetical protein
MDAGFGHWLAGFIDGEGSFTIMYPRSDSPQLYTRFQIRLRADDAEVLEEIRQAVGHGKIYRYEPTARALEALPGSKATALLVIGSTAGSAALVALLDRYPLRAKKARDYAIWREAVSARAEKDWPRMDELKSLLEEGREYGAEPIAEPATVTQLRLVS